MKKTLILFCCLITGYSVFSQIPNGTFEKWIQKKQGLIEYEDPDSGWVTSNQTTLSKGYLTVSKTENWYPYGDWAIKLQSYILAGDTLEAVMYTRRIASSGFAVKTKHESLHGYYKFLPENNDMLTIDVKMYKNGSQVGEGSFTSGDRQMKYVPFSLNVDYSTFTGIPDSATILIAPFEWNDSGMRGKPKGSSILYIDDLSFDSLTTRDITQPEELDISKIVSVTPNPFSDYIEIGVSKKASRPVYAKLITADGRVVIHQPIKGRLLTINTVNIPSGNYCLELTYGNDLKTYELVKKTK